MGLIKSLKYYLKEKYELSNFLNKSGCIPLCLTSYRGLAIVKPYSYKFLPF